MSKRQVFVRPSDNGEGWVVDEYDGRGFWRWTVTTGLYGDPLTKADAQRVAREIRAESRPPRSRKTR